MSAYNNSAYISLQVEEDRPTARADGVAADDELLEDVIGRPSAAGSCWNCFATS